MSVVQSISTTLVNIHHLCFRYFQCVHLFGLFAPVSKVVKAPMATNTPSARRASLNKCSLSALGGAARSRSGSQESISSIGSTASSVSGRGRVRLGVVSLGNQVLLLAAVSKGSSQNSNTPCLIDGPLNLVFLVEL